MKGSYFGFGSPQQQVDMHARSQNTFIVLYYAFICEKTNMWADNMLMFHVDVNMKRLGIRFKNDSFQWFRVDSFFWETITLYMVHFQI